MQSPQTPVFGDRFDHPVVVAAADIDANGHANNVAYLRWVQEAAEAHWNAVVEPAVAAGLSWVVIRHEIDYKKPAFVGESLVASTWVGEITPATTERFCEIHRGASREVLARARTVWCAIDAATSRPRRIGPRIRSWFFGRLPPSPRPDGP